jgi:hydrogenase/urease accessory protein HupE
MAAEAVYILCALTSFACAVMLWRAYARGGGGGRFLLWSCICFAMLAANNVLLFVDKVLLPQVDLTIWRSATAAVGLLLLNYGLIWDAE